MSQTEALFPADQEKLLLEWNNTEMALPKASCIHELLEQKVLQLPNATALICRDAQLTYSELNARANRVASYLSRLDVGPEKLVGICVERSLEMVIGLLGILKAGGAYLPLDPAYPNKRLAFMVEDSKPLVLLTQRSLVQLLPNKSAHVVCLDDCAWVNDLPHSGGAQTSCYPDAKTLAYVIYTSGSTGKPKGVMIEHRNVLNFFAGMDARIPSGDGKTWLAVTSPSFDISVLELFWTLSRGFKVVLYAPDEPQSPASDSTGYSIPALIQRHGVTHLQCTPSMATMLLLDEPTRNALARLQTLLLGGEALPLNLARRLKESFKGTLLNMYGPTETTVWSTTWQLPSDHAPARISVGRPIANTQIYIVDPDLRRVPVGIAGELLIGGVGVARGYLGRDQLTAERFIPNPFLQPSHATALLYRTGDLARYLPDGNIELLGRIDYQVKIRGHRVELGEIEALLNEHPGVRESIVMLRQPTNVDQNLVAYLIPRDGQKPTREELRRYSREKLPDYMVPAHFIFMTAFPQTPNRKIDRNAFPSPETETRELQEDITHPQTEVQVALSAIWKELLRVQNVGLKDNFFEAGGHSMLAMQLVARVRKRLKVELPLRNVFEHQTLGELAETIEALLWSASPKPESPSVGRHEIVEV